MPVRPGRWSSMPGVPVMLALSVAVSGCATPRSELPAWGWTQAGRASTDTELDMRQCRQRAMSPAVVNSKSVLVRRAMVNEEKFAAYMRSRGYR